MRVIGLTGGVATGKSLALQAFREVGAAVLSADAIAHELMAPGKPLAQRVAAEFAGCVLPDGALDRRALGRLVFRDAEARKRLEALVHPPVLERLRCELDRLRNLPRPPEVVVVEVPLLYEVGLQDWFDGVVVVAADEDAQMARLRCRDGLSEEEARLRVAAQMPIAEKEARADWVLRNDGTPEHLRAQVRQMMRNLRARAAVCA